MKFDWVAYRKKLAEKIKEISKSSPYSARRYRDLSRIGDKVQVLDRKTRELMALAVSATLQCDGCIAVHTEAALETGATSEEIAEALGVAIAVNAGASVVYSTRVLDAMAEHDSVL